MGGARTTWEWAHGAPDPQALAPVRRTRSSALSRHIPVQAYSFTTTSHLRLESGLEHDLVRLLDRCDEVSWMVPQPCVLQWPTQKGRKRVKEHIPDLLSASPTGSITIWDVKRVASQDEDFRRVEILTRLACESVGWGYEVFTGLDPVHRHNLMWLHAYRHCPEWASDHEADLRRKCAGGSTLGEVMASSGDEGRAVLWHLIWRGQIQADLTTTLGPSSQVSV